MLCHSSIRDKAIKAPFSHVDLLDSFVDVFLLGNVRLDEFQILFLLP